MRYLVLLAENKGEIKLHYCSFGLGLFISYLMFFYFSKETSTEKYGLLVCDLSKDLDLDSYSK